MKAVLVQFPCWVVDSPPYNIALLKAVCERHGHSIVCLDFNIRFYKYLALELKRSIYGNPTNWYNYEYAEAVINEHSGFVEKCVEEIISMDSRVIGFTVTGLNIRFSKEIAKKIKDKDKSKIIIFGGPHCFKTELGDKLLYTTSYIDAVCYLEGENILPYLLDDIEKHGSIRCLAGIGYREKNGKIIDCGDPRLLKELDTLPFADYSDFNLDEYIAKELPISTSRGCINRCAFCNESKIWGKYRFRDAEGILKEIRHQLSRYPFIESFFFNDSLINGNIKVLDKLCSLLIRNRINIKWGGQALIREEMTKDFIAKLRQAGLCHVSYGLESASPRMLKTMGKHFTSELAERVIRDTKRAGIRVDINIIVGFPTERNEDIIFTANFLKRNREFIDKIFFHPLIVSRGSYIYEHINDFGIEFENVYNLNSWYSTKEENTLQKRLEIIKFYMDYIVDKGKSFLTRTDYCLFIGGSYFNKGDYKNALAYYMEAIRFNNDRLKAGFIRERIQILQRLLGSL